MKKIIPLLCCIPMLTIAQESTFRVNGQLNENTNGNKIYIGYKKEGKRIIDSTLSAKGRFYFTGSIDKGELLFGSIILDRDHLGMEEINTRRGGMDVAKLVLVAGTVNIKGEDSINKAIITDDLNTNTEYKEMNVTKDLAVFAKKYPHSLVSVEALRNIAGSFPNKSSIIPLFSGLSPEIQESKMGKAFVQFMENFSTVVTGSIAPDFIQADMQGKSVKLTDFRGKYILLDFWASWCGPCRKANPDLVKIYTEFNKMNFTILGVSLDRDKQEWLDAIKKDGLTWMHVSDLKHFENGVALQYGIAAIPQSVLIDPSGKIIAKNLLPDDLRSKLNEVLR